MPRHRTLILLALGAAVWGCGRDSTGPATLISDAQVSADVAAAAGDAIATDVTTMIGNEVFLALPTPGLNFDLFGATTDTILIDRSRLCYDASDVEVLNCQPLASVRKIVLHIALDGVHNGTLLRTAVHRVRDWTLTRLFTDATETARQHDGVGSANDTTEYDNPTTQVTRTHRLAALDSVIAVVFDLPRLTNPWPVSGTMVRRVAVHSTFASPTRQETRDYTKRIEVDFPADAQGNVVLLIDSQTCNLNLVTHTVTGCH